MGRGREVGYINVSVFGDSAEAAAKYLSKGWLVAVGGRLEYGEWETHAGEKRRAYVIVGNVEFLTSPRPVEEPAKPALRKKEPVAAQAPRWPVPLDRVRAIAVAMWAARDPALAPRAERGTPAAAGSAGWSCLTGFVVQAIWGDG
jgi:single-stranded DNA-binding protein